MSDWPLFSIIIPVKNAASQIRDCLESIKNIDYPQDKIEIILADGLSQDATREIGRSLGAKVITNPKQTVGPGRNLGFFHARGEYIAFTDADCILDKQWLRSSLKYFQDQTIAGVSGPSITPSEGSHFEQAIKVLYILGNRLYGSVHLEKLDNPKWVKDLPGCNAIYSRRALKKVMPIDEDLLTAEDAQMNFRLKQLGLKLLFAPEIIVYHHRRSNPKMLWQQMYRFAIGRLQVGKRNIRMINVAHILAGLFIPLVVTAELRLYLLNPVYLLINIIAILTVLVVGWLFSKSFIRGLNFLIVFFISTIAYSCGFLRELCFPLKDVTGK